MKGTARVLVGLTLTCLTLSDLPTAARAAPSAGVDASLGEIIVTAQRRDENLQRVPVAITVADGDALASTRVQNIANIQAISPSVTFRTANLASSSANLVIRGIGTTGNSRTFEGSAGVFIDGVYRTRSAVALQTFLDIDSLQILRGPQGTLFGKNTNAGALLLSSSRPSISRVEGFIDLGYGNYNSVLARGAINAPLGATSAFRVAGAVSRNDGFFTDVNTGRNLNGDTTKAIKAQLLFEPSANISIRLIGDYSHSVGNCCYATATLVAGPAQPFIDALITAAGRRLPSARPADRQQSLNGNGRQVVEDYGGTLLVDIGIGAGTLKSVTGVRRYRIGQTDMDPDFSGADIFRYSESFASRFVSQEVTYAVPVPALRANIVVGGFASDETLTMDRQLPWAVQAQPLWDDILSGLGLPPGTADAAPGLIADEAMGGTARSWSGFGHIDAAVDNRLHLIAGLRYSVETKTGRFHYRYYRPQPNEPFRLLGIQPGPPYGDRATDRAISGTFGVSFLPGPGAMVYATYNRGFKAGGVNIDANGAGTRADNPAEVPGGVPLSPVYKPERIDTFELGGKFDYLDGRARTNIALFYNHLSDLQIAQFVGLRSTVLNARSATSYGLEIENLVELAGGLTLAADATWLPHARYADDPGIDPVLSGSRFRFAPKLAANVALDLEHPITADLDLVGRLQYQFTGAQLINTAGTDRQGPVSLVNGSIGLKLPRRDLLFEAWAQNLCNVTFATQALATPLEAGSVSGFLGAPRTFGVRLRQGF